MKFEYFQFKRIPKFSLIIHVDYQREGGRPIVEVYLLGIITDVRFHTLQTNRHCVINILLLIDNLVIPGVKYMYKQLNMCHWGEYNSIFTWMGKKSLCYNYFITILCTNYSIYNKEASVCVVKRRLLFYNIYPHFLISTLALRGKDIGKWETGHTARSHKEKLNAVFPYLWTVFKLYRCRTEERASNTYKARSSSCAAVR